jgi:hypothetical protein
LKLGSWEDEKKKKKEVLRLGSWEDGKKEEKGSSEVRKLGR